MTAAGLKCGGYAWVVGCSQGCWRLAKSVSACSSCSVRRLGSSLVGQARASQVVWLQKPAWMWCRTSMSGLKGQAEQDQRDHCQR